MVRRYLIDPAAFDGAKLAARYGLDPLKDFRGGRDDQGRHFVEIRDGLPQVPAPPVFDAPDPPFDDAGEMSGINATLAQIGQGNGAAQIATLNDVVAKLLRRMKRRGAL